MHYFTAKRTEHKENPSKRYIGVEIEVDGYEGEGYNIADAVDFWSGSIVSDGSLGCGGIEIVTSPASGDKLCNMLDAIGSAMRDDRAFVSNDCGLHVHIDARDYTHYDMRRLIALYAALEPAIMETQPRSRRRNTYCSPCGDTLSNGLKDAKRPRDTKNKLLENIYKENPNADRGRGVRVRRRDKYDNARYMALNLHSWLYRGTVECRLHTGTVNARKIKAWAMLWADVLDYALATPESKIIGKAKGLTKKGARRWLRKIARTKATKRYLDERWARYGNEKPAETRWA